LIAGARSPLANARSTEQITRAPEQIASTPLLVARRPAPPLITDIDLRCAKEGNEAIFNPLAMLMKLAFMDLTRRFGFAMLSLC
jgi:hypothetical protein